jgi:hypothetical protein
MTGFVEKQKTRRSLRESSGWWKCGALVATTAPALRYAEREPVSRYATSAEKISRERYKREVGGVQRIFRAQVSWKRLPSALQG